MKQIPSSIWVLLGLSLWMIASFSVFEKKYNIAQRMLQRISPSYMKNTDSNTLKLPPTPSSPVERWKRDIGIQKCKIPTFDALHPQILPYVNLDEKNPKSLGQKAKIENGMLKLKLQHEFIATFNYIRRHQDYKYEMSDPVNLISNREKKGCIESILESCILQVLDDESGTKNSLNSASLQCKKGSCDTNEDQKVFIFQLDGKIIHKKSGKCLQSAGCIEKSTVYEDRNTFIVYTGVGSAQSCQEYCKSNEKCNAWTYIKEKKNCRLQDKPGDRIHNKEGHESGPKTCKAESYPHLLATDGDKCNNIWSTFRYNNSIGRLQHLASLTCISAQPSGEVRLSDCNNLTTHLKVPTNLMPDINVSHHVSYPLTEEFIRLKYRDEHGNPVTEYLSHVIEKNLKYDVTKRQNDEELNIVMIMLDSQSNKNIERQFRKTFHFLSNNPYTVLLNNHVITGDGTTANLGPMLAGKHVVDLPEARPWFKGSQYLDRWPLIFKNFQKKGYVTLYGDDDPFLGALHYRLSGFKELPTDKYLLPFFYSTDCSYQSCHQYAFDYLYKYIDTYRPYKHFSFMSLGKLGHDKLDRIRYGDNHTHAFMESLLGDKKHRNNTAIFLFGDHGHRTAKIRKTIWGKLEERLPFMSITLPPWFFKKYKEKISLLKLNSHVLTSHFDIYQTLLHLLNPKTYEKSGDKSETNKTSHDKMPSRDMFGESLFTNIAPLNRTCEDAGVPLHFCPCTEYKLANTNDTLVLEIFNKTVSFINTMITNSTTEEGFCSELKLKEMIRARSVAPSEKMQKHKETFETSKCGRCGLKEDKNFKMKVTQYEIVFSVEPSRGVFEATVEYLHDIKTIRVNPDISRVNRYGEQPKCIAKRFPHLRKYCFCKDFPR